MSKAKILCGFFLITFMMGCSAFLVCLILTDSINQNIGFSQGIISTTEDAITSRYEDPSISADGGDEVETRLSQQVAVYRGDKIFPISGTVTKVKDAYYPGTYEIKFARNCDLKTWTQVKATIDAKAGEKVYVLVGDKDQGYFQYTTVLADADGSISFFTHSLRDFTVSTTDIVTAQSRVEAILSMGSIY